MNRETFNNELQKELSGLPEGDRQHFLEYYDEMISDRIEDGMSEQEAISALGKPSDIAGQILIDSPFGTLVKAKLRKKRELKAFDIVLIVLGFPIWFPLLLAVTVCILSVYIVLWSVIISAFAVDLSLAVSGVAAIVFAFYAFVANANGLFYIGAGIILIGISGLLLLLTAVLTRGIIYLTKVFGKSIKKLFIKG